MNYCQTVPEKYKKIIAEKFCNLSLIDGFWINDSIKIDKKDWLEDDNSEMIISLLIEKFERLPHFRFSQSENGYWAVNYSLPNWREIKMRIGKNKMHVLIVASLDSLKLWEWYTERTKEQYESFLKFLEN